MAAAMFSDLEGLKMAIEIESRGCAFYQQAYENAQQAEHKETFLFLKNEEVEHRNKFTDIFNQLKDNKDAETTDYLYDQETSRYLAVLVHDHVFPKEQEVAAKLAELTSIEAILRMAIQAEKDSILFYGELANKAKFEDAKKIFTELKMEEQTHVVKLMEILKAWA